jgi:hypothetical protein
MVGRVRGADGDLYAQGRTLRQVGDELGVPWTAASRANLAVCGWFVDPHSKVRRSLRRGAPPPEVWRVRLLGRSIYDFAVVQAAESRFAFTGLGHLSRNIALTGVAPS